MGDQCRFANVRGKASPGVQDIARRAIQAASRLARSVRDNKILLLVWIGAG